MQKVTADYCTLRPARELAGKTATVTVDKRYRALHCARLRASARPADTPVRDDEQFSALALFLCASMTGAAQSRSKAYGRRNKSWIKPQEGNHVGRIKLDAGAPRL